MTDWLTSADACAYLKVSRWTLARYVRARRLRAYGLPGGDRRFKREDLDALLTALDPDAVQEAEERPDSTDGA